MVVQLDVHAGGTAATIAIVHPAGFGPHTGRCLLVDQCVVVALIATDENPPARDRETAGVEAVPGAVRLHPGAADVLEDHGGVGELDDRDAVFHHEAGAQEFRRFGDVEQRPLESPLSVGATLIQQCRAAARAIRERDDGISIDRDLAEELVSGSGRRQQFRVANRVSACGGANADPQREQD